MQGFLERVRSAMESLRSYRTPLEFAPNLSEQLGVNVSLKREDDAHLAPQSYRGALRRIASLSESELERGVVAFSAGTHALGSALAARELGTKCIVFMPVTAPAYKVRRLRLEGAEVVLSGDTFEDAFWAARRYSESHGMALIHPTEDEHVLEGYGTVGLELAEQMLDNVDAVFLPSIGGGFACAVAHVVKALRPEIKVFAAEPRGVPSLHHGMEAGRPVLIERLETFALETAYRRVPQPCLDLAKGCIDEVVLVDDDAISAGIRDMYHELGVALDGTTGVTVAAMKRYARDHDLRGKSVVAVTTGAALTFSTLRYVADRAEFGDNEEALLAVSIPESPGSLLRFCRALSERTITEFNYRFTEDSIAHLLVGLRTTGAHDIERLTSELQEQGYQAADLTDNELAKRFVKNMIGGKPSGMSGERLFVFSIPERPGGLLHFLERLSRNWNICLFQYRFSGSEEGLVLVGLQIPKEDAVAFHEFLQGLGFEHREETQNAAVRMFLQA